MPPIVLDPAEVNRVHLLAAVLGNMALGGTLVVTKAGAAPLAAGDTFKLVNAASYSGRFSALVLPSLSAGLAWDTTGLGTNGSLAVISLSPPMLSPPLPLGNGTFRLIFSGSAGQNYELRASTNIGLSPLTSWSLLNGGIFGTGQVMFDDLQATNYPQRFYRVRVP